MSQGRELTVRLQTLGGTWETCGVDRGRGLAPENVVMAANPWGSDQASFDLRRHPGTAWPDLFAFTPVEIEVAGVIVWTGRVKQTPTKDGTERVINVQCEGWQYHLDDDVYQRVYAHTGLGDFKDLRSVPTMDLTHCPQAGTVANDNGTITLGWPNGTVFPGNDSYVGVMLDLGPGQTCTAVSADWDSSNNTAVHELLVSATNFANPFAGAGTDVVHWAVNTGATGTTVGTVAASRYVLLALRYSGAAATSTADVWIRIKAVRVFGSTTYHSGGASVLNASTVATDALAQATSMLSADTSRVAATSFVIPDFNPGEPRTPRENIQAVNAYHDYITKVDVNQRLIFEAKPTIPDLEVGTWSAMEIDDASANSGDDIYNRVTVTGQTPDGTRISHLVTLSAANNSLVGVRQGFNRTKILPVQSSLPSDLVAAGQIGATWLEGHKLAAFKGTITLTGQRSLRDIRSGGSVGLEHLLTRTGELIRFSDRVDPDTGGFARDGRIAGVSYDFAKDQATVTIDNSRANFEALLSRLAVVTGAG